MKFEEVLGDFSEKTGLGRLGTDADGSVGLMFDNQHEIFFTPDAVDESLLVYCEIADAGRLEKDELLRLMKASLLGAETGGASFGIHEGLKKIVLWKRFDNSFESVSDLEKKINTFLAQVIYWKEHIGERSADREIHAESDNSDSGFNLSAMSV